MFTPNPLVSIHGEVSVDYMFRMRGCKSNRPTLMKLTTICDVSHEISYTRPSSPLFFSGGIERKAWERARLLLVVLHVRTIDV